MYQFAPILHSTNTFTKNKKGKFYLFFTEYVYDLTSIHFLPDTVIKMSKAKTSFDSLDNRKTYKHKNCSCSLNCLCHVRENTSNVSSSYLCTRRSAIIQPLKTEDKERLKHTMVLLRLEKYGL